MGKVAIVTDSTCDLTKEIIEEKNIIVLPLYVNFAEKNESYKDGVDIDTVGLYKLIEKHGVLPKTSAVTPGDFLLVFENLLAEGYDIVFSGLSSKMSKTFENAALIAKELDPNRIFVVDSLNLSSGIGLLILKACEYRDEGMNASMIASKLEEIVPSVKSQFAIETMEYLYKGGRCSSLTRLIGTVLKIKPIIFVRDGSMAVGKKPHGKMKVALDSLLAMIEEDKEKVDMDYIMVTHSLAFDSSKYLHPILKEMFPKAKILDTIAGSVISSHCGVGTIGILYIIK